MGNQEDIVGALREALAALEPERREQLVGGLRNLLAIAESRDAGSPLLESVVDRFAALLPPEDQSDARRLDIPMVPVRESPEM